MAMQPREMAMQPREMAMQPREMEAPDTNPLANMPPEAVEALMQPDDDIQAVLVARLSNMAPQELQMLDAAVTPEVAAVLVRLLPELRDLVDAVSGEIEIPAEEPMGALSGM
jgi:hypothetical protein